MQCKRNWLFLGLIVIVVVAFVLTKCSASRPATESAPASNPVHATVETAATLPMTVAAVVSNNPLCFPGLSAMDTVVHHPGFDLVYSEIHEQARWVAYTLTAAETLGEEERTDNFREDPNVPTGTASLEDYRGSGYDRGHLVPAADLAWSDSSMSASFYFSNMSPQHPSFNRGIWKKLEAQVREWAVTFDSLHVVTGPCFTDSLGVIGHNQVCVPRHYFKALLVQNDTTMQAAGFWLANDRSIAPLSDFLVPIDSLEHWLQLDFWPNLADSVEVSLEAQVDSSFWF